MSCRPIGKAPNMIGIFPTMCGEKYFGAMGTSAVRAVGHTMNGIPLTLDIWSCITSRITPAAVKTSKRI